MTALTCSRRNCFTRNIPSPMIMAEVSSGPVHLEESKNQPLLSQHNRLQPSKTTLLKPSHPLNIAPQKQNAANSPSCSVISWTPPSSPANSIPKNTEMWYVPINRLVLKSSSAMRDISHNFLVTVCSSISAIPKPMKMTPKEQYGLGWECLLPWET